MLLSMALRWRVSAMNDVEANNFLVSYGGRVGSTALIDSLKLLPNFLVPVFEEYDAWYIDKHNLHDEFDEHNIADAVDEVYTSHKSPGVSVGFKWRIWGDIAAAEAVLHKHNVVVFNMVRSDGFEFFSSLYLSDVVHGEFNAPQFLLKDATSDEERRQILFRYRMQTHCVNLPQFRSLFEEGTERERERLSILKRFHRSGLEVVTIFYEDFAYKRFRFLNAFLRRLGHPGAKFLPDPTIRKVGLPYPSELFENREDVMSSDWLQDAIGEWDRVVAPRRLETLRI
jgi:hypothetical protein